MNLLIISRIFLSIINFNTPKKGLNKFILKDISPFRSKTSSPNIGSAVSKILFDKLGSVFNAYK